MAADGVDELVACCHSGAGTTSTQRRARAPAVGVRAVAFDRAETGRAVTTTHSEQPIITANIRAPSPSVLLLADIGLNIRWVDPRLRLAGYLGWVGVGSSFSVSMCWVGLSRRK